MTLTFTTTKEQDAALIAHHAFTAPEVSFEIWMQGQMGSIVGNIVTWYNEQRLEAVKRAYLVASPVQRANVDTELAVDIVAARQNG